MPRAFLAHSSQQKWFVDVVAQKIVGDEIAYDALTFEIGGKTFEEILIELGNSDIFVLFLSDSALNSSWVKREINQATKLLDEGKIKKILAFIIDDTIRFDDPRIPQWLIDNYNLQYVSRPIKAVERIKHTLKFLAWDLYPKNKAIHNLFIGRLEQRKKYEERIYNPDLNTPISLIASGLPSVGRRKLLTHLLVDSGKMRVEHQPPIILLNNRDSIENFILNVYDLGFSETRPPEDLMNISLAKKIEVGYALIKDIASNNSKLFILDNYCIVGIDGTVAEWFLAIMDKLKDFNKVVVCCASRIRAKQHLLHGKNYIFCIDVPELDKNERRALFSSLLDLERIVLERVNINTISELFGGYPEQIFYSIELIKSMGINSLLNNLNLIVYFNSEKVTQVMIKYETDDGAQNLLRLLAEYEYMSVNLLNQYISDNPRYNDLMMQFNNLAIIEFIGADRDILRLNDSIRDHILRIGNALDPTFRKILEKISAEFIDDYEKLDRDISDFTYSMQKALQEGKDISTKYLIPSHFLNSMKVLYDRKNYNNVISLADRVLQNSTHIDKRIIRETYFWLCQALARTRNDRFLTEVRNIDGNDHDFLFGFYYRNKSENKKAIDRYKKILNVNPKYYRAVSELVRVYINIEDYENAYLLAKDNYEYDRSNPYFIQNYITCLVKLRNHPDYRFNDIDIEHALKNLDKIKSDKAQEMYLTCKAQYEAFIHNDKDEAISIINSAITRYPEHIHPKLAKISIAIKFRDVPLLESIIDQDKSDTTQKDFYYSILLSSQAKLLAMKGQIKEAYNIVETKLKYHYPEYALEKLKVELDNLQPPNVDFN